MISHYAQLKPYITKDGSIIREMMHPKIHGNAGASVAEATIPVGTTTLMHMHTLSEEIYVVTQGAGRMQLGDKSFDIHTGDTITIAPRTMHSVGNSGNTDLVIICVCVPAYEHDETYLACE
jgi:mannose-6-phosphate isomerase-like protein (cupin superfamily)